MKKVTLYRYTREDGGVTVTPNRPKTAGYTIKHRLFSDECMTLTNGQIVASCIDVDSIDGWSEIADETEEVVEESKQNLYNYWKVNLHAILQGSQG